MNHEDEEALADARVDEDARLAAEGKGRCVYCGRPYKLTRAGGKVRRHGIRGKRGFCGGSGRQPA